MLLDLSHLGLLKIAGEGAKKLLQGQLTCNLDEITEMESRLGAHCNPQGRILSFFRIFLFQENYYLQMPHSILPITLSGLQKYAIFFKVNLSDATSDLKQVALTNTELSHFFSSLPKQINETCINDGFLIIKILPSHSLIISTPGKIDNVFLHLKKHADSLNAWKKLQIENGIPSIYNETSSQLLPHEINLHLLNAISFNKGCYTGQEIIARMHYRGQLKKQMYRAKVKSDLAPQPGHDIYNEKGISGTIVDSCKEEDGFYQLLVIANQEEKEHKHLFLNPDKIQPLEFLTLP